MTYKRYEPPIAFDRLQKMLSEIESGSELSAEIRGEIWGALDVLYLMLLIERDGHTKGRRIADHTWVAATIALTLVQKHSVSIDNAAWAAAPNVSIRGHGAILRACTKLKSLPNYPQMPMQINQEVIEKAEQRLRLRDSKIGNK